MKWEISNFSSLNQKFGGKMFKRDTNMEAHALQCLLINLIYLLPRLETEVLRRKVTHL